MAVTAPRRRPSPPSLPCARFAVSWLRPAWRGRRASRPSSRRWWASARRGCSRARASAASSSAHARLSRQPRQLRCPRWTRLCSTAARLPRRYCGRSWGQTPTCGLRSRAFIEAVRPRLQATRPARQSCRPAWRQSSWPWPGPGRWGWSGRWRGRPRAVGAGRARAACCPPPPSCRERGPSCRCPTSRGLRGRARECTPSAHHRSAPACPAAPRRPPGCPLRCS
mmetsp:Transcript_706/g.2506  ORF Transcript_706/g.2506 Transcript_706/m.2506 type:complete len:224 (-) Transcript_706:1430-2101(-)